MAEIAEGTEFSVRLYMKGKKTLVLVGDLVFAPVGEIDGSFVTIRLMGTLTTDGWGKTYADPITLHVNVDEIALIAGVGGVIEADGYPSYFSV